MSNNNWTFKFSLKITGETSVGEGVDLNRTIQIPLLVTTEKAAERHATLIVKFFTKAAKESDTEFFKQYCSAIDDEDGLAFNNFRIFRQGKRTLREKKLDIHVPEIIAGP